MDPRLELIPERPTDAWLLARARELSSLDVLEGPPSSLILTVAPASEQLRHFTAVLLADWACYVAPADKVTPERLRQAMDTFPQGFRSWWIRSPDRDWLPVGYSGWYPVSKETFSLLEQGALSAGRSVPAISLAEEGALLYLFNYSVLPPLRGSEVARRLVRGLADEVNALQPRGVAALTVSSDGARVAQRFGMRPKDRGLYLLRR